MRMRGWAANNPPGKLAQLTAVIKKFETGQARSGATNTAANDVNDSPIEPLKQMKSGN